MRTSTSARLKQIMSERNLKQVDIIKQSEPLQKKFNIKMSKSALSQYVNGVQLPDQHRIFLLSRSLNVNEPWLMGYDVPKERQVSDDILETTHNEHYDRSKQQKVLTPEALMLDNIKQVVKDLEFERQKKVFDFAEQQLAEQKKIAQFPSTSKVETLAAHSSDPDKKYSLEKIEEINQHLDKIDKEHGIKKD